MDRKKIDIVNTFTINLPFPHGHVIIYNIENCITSFTRIYSLSNKMYMQNYNTLFRFTEFVINIIIN